MNRKLFKCTPDNSMRIPAGQARLLLCLPLALLFTFTAVLAHAQEYTSIVVFGDSLSDTGNVAHLTNAKYGERIPGPDADYTDGRFTDGADTLPAAQKYFGVWIEQFAAMLPSKPSIKTVSYTHLDVYKRQVPLRAKPRSWPSLTLCFSTLIVTTGRKQPLRRPVRYSK